MLTPLLLLAALALPVDDLASRLDDALLRLARSEGAERWELVAELRDLARSDSTVAVPHLVDRAGQGDGGRRLAIAATLLEVDAPHEAAALLLPLLDGEHHEQALVVLSDQAFRQVDEVADTLAAALERPGPADRRVAVARTLYKVGNARRKIAARPVLHEALESDDPDVRADAALALAEIGDFDACRRELRVLAADPGPRGHVARAYLSLDDKIDYYDKKLYRQNQLTIDDVGGGRGHGFSAGSEQYQQGPGSLDVLEELIAAIQDNHLLGEHFIDSEGREKLITAAAKGMLMALDPHSTYFSGAEFERWILDLRRHYAGIGAYVDTINQVFTITKPIYSGPAYGADLLSGDQILKVDGWDTFNQPNDEIIKRLKGEPGTEVTISVYRKGWPETRDFTITREVIDIDSVNWERLPGDLAYVEVLSFADTTSAELAEALVELQEQGVSGMILDLRNNSGGYLDEAVRMCSLFLDPGQLVVYTEGRRSPREEFQTLPMPGEIYRGPLVVLVNERSASASEIVAGCLQEYGRATVVGDTTYGKGSVQQAMPLDSRPGDTLLTDRNHNGAYDPGEQYDDNDGDGKYSYPVNVKITNARYYLPSGRSLHTERDLDWRIVQEGGVEPDVEVAFEGIPGWQNHEWALLLDKLGERQPFKDYVFERFGRHRDLFYEIAAGDDHDTSLYPDWEAFRETLETGLPDDTIRLLLRGEVRNAVADDRGKAFPGGLVYGDWQEDSQLQMAIAVLAHDLPFDMGSFAAYDDFADLDPFAAPSLEDDGEEEGEAR